MAVHGRQGAEAVLRSVDGVRTGEDVEDLRSWLLTLTGGPDVHETVVLHCDGHDDASATWAYVEADASSGIARRRCLACGAARSLLDSDQRWTHPPMWACRGCGQSIAELAVGLSLPDGEHVRWLALAARCVQCGRLAGLADALVPDQPLSEVLRRL
jgi:ribosomal protein S14